MKKKILRSLCSLALTAALLTNNDLMSGKDGGWAAPLDNTKIEEAVVLILALCNRFERIAE